MAFDINSAKAALEGGMSEAQELIRDPAKIEGLLVNMEAALKDIPVAGDTLSKVPLTVSLIKSYITKEYTEVSPKVIVSLLSAFIYLLKKKDLIADNIPLLGQVDDIAVMGLALNFVEPELNAYAQWREQKNAPAAEAPAAEVPAAEAPAAEASAAEAPAAEASAGEERAEA
ncbi:MAG: DUF1232 domain-containing protein [Lachnospiraceae bacterium]|nr:DUF1232 domain-containing protein [Lachnospiraceae bacterium]